MKCGTARKVNNKTIGKEGNNIVRKYGAKSLVMSIRAHMDPATLKVTYDAISHKKFIASLKDMDHKTVALNYVFTSDLYSDEGFNALSKDDNITKYINGKLPKDISEKGMQLIGKMFSDKSMVINEAPRKGDRHVFIHDSKKSDIKTFLGGNVVRITKADVDAMNAFNIDEAAALMEFAISSALHRGYDVLVPKMTNYTVAQNAIKKFNSTSPTHKSVLATSLLGVVDARRFVDFKTYERGITESNIKHHEEIGFEGNLLISDFLSPSENTRLLARRKVKTAEKIRVATTLMKTFEKVNKNIKWDILSTNEITKLYGEQFSNKKGFIIAGKIVLNLDLFTNETVFHEFSHFFAKWMAESDAKSYSKLMDNAKESPEYESVRKAYLSAGINLNESEVAEEVFARIIGMNASGEFSKLMKDSKNFTESEFEAVVDKFIKVFSTKLVGMVSYSGKLNKLSTISDIFNFQYSNINLNTEHDLASESFMRSFINFEYPRLSKPEAFKALVENGYIKLEDGKMYLYDMNGNSVNRHGAYGDSGKLSFRTDDYLNEYARKKNSKVIEDISGYINKMAPLLDLKFDIGTPSVTSAEQGRDVLNINTLGVELKLDESMYVQDGIDLRRVSSVIEGDFSNPVEEDHYIKITMHKEFLEEHYATYDLDAIHDPTERKTIDDKVIEDVSKLMHDTTDPRYKAKYTEIATLFLNKQEEGTLLHEIAELLVRSLNIVQSIDYDTKYEKTYLYFFNEITAAISNPDKAEFRNYFERYIKSRHPDKGSREYKDFVKILDIIDSKLLPNDAGRVNDYLLKLRNIFNTQIFKKLNGPLIFMPEVKLASKELGIAGTIDLLVFDRDGIAHIFDYKTKEVGKERNWAFPSELRMTGELAAYRNNAKMKASVQTSLYKLMLSRMGIRAGSAKVFYVAGVIDDSSTMYADDKLRFRYNVSDISVEPLAEVSSELSAHFKDALDPKGIIANSSKDIMDTINMAAGQNIDIVSNLDEVAENIYKSAVDDVAGGYGKVNDVIAGLLGGSEGLKVKLFSGIEYNIPKEYVTKAEIVDHIKDVLSKNISAKSQEALLEEIFHSGEMSEHGIEKDIAYKALLAGADESTHEFVKMSSIAHLGQDFSGISMIRDKVTGQVRMMVLNHDRPQFLAYGLNRKNRQHIFGNYVSSASVANRVANIEWKNTNHDMRLIKAGLMAMRMRQLDPSFSVSMVISNSVNASKGTPNLEDMDTIILMTKTLIGVMVESGENVPKSIVDMVNDPILTDPASYVSNPMESLSAYISVVADSAIPFKEATMYRSKHAKKKVEQLRDALDGFDGITGFTPLWSAIHNFRTTLDRNLTTAEKIDNGLWELTENVMMSMLSFNYDLSPKNPGFVDRYISTPSKAANAHQAAVSRKVTEADVELSADYMEYKNKFNVLLTALAEENGVDINSTVQLSLSQKGIFKGLFKNNNTDRSDAFILKSPTDRGVTKAEADILRFMKEQFEFFAEETVYRDVEIPFGWMPLLPKTKLSLQSSTKNPLERAKRVLIGMRTATNKYGGEMELSEELQFTTENPFATQMPRNEKESRDVAGQYTSARRDKLGIDEFGNDLANIDERPIDMIEDNIENILDSFVLASLETKHHRDITAFGRSMIFNIKRREKIANTSFGVLTNVLTIIQKRVINHETSDGKNAAITAMNTLATNVVVSGNLSQILLETFTNPMVTATNFFADKIYGDLFQGERKFSSASYAKAMQYVMNPLSEESKIIDKLDLLYGITNGDNIHVKEKLNKLESSLFQTKHLMFFNKLMLDSWQKITFAAFLIETGTLKAHAIDVYGNVVYNQDKDGRFYTGKNPQTESDLYKSKLFESVKERLARTRGGLTGTDSVDFSKRRLKRALAPEEKNEIKELITQVYSSMDEQSKGLLMFYTSLGFMGKMRSWLFPKMPRYFQQPMTAEQNKSAARPVKVLDTSAEGGYRIEWKGVPAEGIYYTLKYLTKRLADEKTTMIKNGANLKPHQKENISKLLSDTLMFAIMNAAAVGLFAYALDDRDRKNPAIQLLHKKFLMATGDIFLIYSLLDVTAGQGSMYVSLSMASNAVNGLWKVLSTSAMAIGDPDVTQTDVLAALNYLGKSTHGLYKTGEFVYDQVTAEL